MGFRAVNWMKWFFSQVFLFVSAILVGEATGFTEEANAQILNELPFDNTQDFQDANRGLIAPLPDNGVIKDKKGNVVWDLEAYSFLQNGDPAPDTVNPSLWRQAHLLYKSGLFHVTDRIYQVRGADLSNMTIIEGDKGIIVIDPLVSAETAKAALDLYYQHRPKKPIKAVIYTHSHVDHFGGVKGIISQSDVDKGKVKVIAPKGFNEAAIEENVMAGNAMSRRAMYMYGNLIPPGPKSQMTSGLGLGTSSGEVTLILPTDFVGKTGEKMTIDGVKFVFIFAPHSEAPAEMLFYLPDFKAIGIAEDATHTLHNLYTLRGAKVRDARLWSKYLHQAIEMFGSEAEVIFAQHHWPIWQNKRVVDYLEKQRDLYKYLHDQTLRLANKGYTMIEIAEMMKLPDSLSQEWYNRGYYGSVNHNAKAVYNYYLGWFDGNPSTLHQLPPAEASKKYIEYMGGADQVLQRAQSDIDQGNYRWVAQVLNHIVYADPKNERAKEVLANVLEQLGYQAENGTWRNFYLTGAKELREGVRKGAAPSTVSPDILNAMPTPMMIDYIATRLNGLQAAQHPALFNLNLPDTKEKYVLQVKNGVLNSFANKNSKEAIATITIKRSDFNQLLLGEITKEELLDSGKLKVEGNREAFIQFLSLIDGLNPWFNIVEPNPPLKEK